MQTERGELRKQSSWVKSIHFTGSTQNIELLLPMVTSVNQLSLYGAVADTIEELPVGRRGLGKPVASHEERQENLLQEYEQRFEKLSEDKKLSRLCSEAGLRLVEVGQIFFALPSPGGKAN